MAGSSNFLQWNPDKNNQQTDVQYNADTMRADGAASGVFESPLANKLFYQCSIMAAGIAQILADRGYVVSDADYPALKVVLANLLDTTLGDERYVRRAFSPAPVYPEINAASNKLTLTAGANSIAVDVGQYFTMRGAKQYHTNDFDLAHRQFTGLTNSHTYHLRFVVTTLDGGRDNFGNAFYAGKGIASESFYIIDTADVAYNPTSLSEASATFDSKMDDMLIAKVAVNGGGVVTATALANAARLMSCIDLEGALTNSPNWSLWGSGAATLNWARVPKISKPYLTGVRSVSNPIDGVAYSITSVGALSTLCFRVTPNSLTRYGGTLDIAYDDVGGPLNESPPGTWGITDIHNLGYGFVSWTSFA